MNYTTLTNQIKNYANRTDTFFVNSIPDFINQGINRIYYEAKDIGFEKTTPASNFNIGQPLVQKPLDWRETISFSFVVPGTPAEVNFLLPRSYEFCISYSPDGTAQDQPKFYSDRGYDNFYITPTPNLAYQYQLNYLATPLFNAQNPTNFLTDRYPNLLLYSCLMEIIPYLRDDERVPTIKQYYNDTLQTVNNNAKGRKTDSLTTRSKD